MMPISAELGDEPLTRHEKIELLNKRFFEALVRFEECMNGAGGFGNAGSGGQGGGSSGSQTLGASIESVAVSDIRGTEVPESQPEYEYSETSETIFEPTQAETLQTANGKMPEQLEATDNDAILLEQIRQAAIAEQDPVLQKKLWQEYNRRKSAAGGS